MNRQTLDGVVKTSTMEWKPLDESGVDTRGISVKALRTDPVTRRSRAGGRGDAKARALHVHEQIFEASLRDAKPPFVQRVHRKSAAGETFYRAGLRARTRNRLPGHSGRTVTISKPAAFNSSTTVSLATP